MSKKVLSIGSLLVLILIFYGRLIYPKALLVVTPDFGKSDSWHSSISAKMLLSEKLHSNQFPLWSQKIGSGVPVFAEGLIGAAFLPNLIIFRLFNPVTGITLSYILSAMILGTGMYVWTKAMGFTALPSFLGAVTVTFSGITIPQLTHLTLLPAQALIPWVFWATRELALKKTWRWTAILAAIVGQQILTGYPQAVFIALLFAAPYYIYLQWNKRSTRTILFGVIALILAAGAAAIQLIPSQEYLQQSTVVDGYTPGMASFFSYPIKHLKTLIDPFALGNPKEGTYPSFIQLNGSIFWENSGYVGIVPLIALVIYLMFFLKKNIGTKGGGVFLIGIVLSFLLMTGKFSPLYIVYSFWPFTLFRVPSRFLWIFSFCLIMLFVHMAQTVWVRCKSTLSKNLFILLSGLHIISLFIPWWNYHALGDAKAWLTPPQTTTLIRVADRILTLGAETTHNQQFLTQGWKDMSLYFILRNALQPNSNITFNVNQQEAYIGRPLRRNTLADSLLADAIPQGRKEATVSAAGEKLLDIFSINTLASTLPIITTLLHRGSMKEGDITIDTYQNFDALPKVYLATTPILVSSAEEAGRALVHPSFKPGKSVLVEQTIDLTATTATATLWTFEDDTIEITTNTDGTAVLVIAMTYYPGWVTTIDGKDTQTIPVNMRQTGVVVPAGFHTVTLMYQPMSIAVGGLISGIAWIIIGLLMVFPRPFGWRRSVLPK